MRAYLGNLKIFSPIHLIFISSSMFLIWNMPVDILHIFFSSMWIDSILTMDSSMSSTTDWIDSVIPGLLRHFWTSLKE